ncbi:MAG: OmpH family outer membrane protein [Flavobacteriaceae bacterium]|nr:OmpH family outer membrane protein [Mangrovimonas sp.]MCB0471110.1 OmpH family outer membrane protein [Flavobacteriaceae bacterium]MCB0427670.1 OmpH family outer membrane protein [Mangrovimonas sp.]MCB0432179.1 OmpH family outer membrane protein [Mangrovimonas sp.]MCB0435671.1 OmpH family outer membrane protein [Mangrovimonas sp.]
MKQLKTILFATVLSLGVLGFAQAQSKVAHINSTDLIQAMPEMKSAQAQMEKLGKTYEADIKDMATQLDTKAKQYDSEAATQTTEQNAKRAQELQTMENNIRQYQAQAQRDMQQKEMDLLQPITEKAKAAILKVARAQGYEYVLDSSQGNGVIMADGKDLLNDVKKELGI